ncbi:hypothetical protein [Streptomyces somaliensis]|uniref:hypothetical protein n=1 Tax=Streptomyces somaliensis TaxID=78355 RepID=UPI0034E97A1B|nr:hypothetical protein [Streptomyces somaliensis]
MGRRCGRTALRCRISATPEGSGGNGRRRAPRHRTGRRTRARLPAPRPAHRGGGRRRPGGPAARPAGRGLRPGRHVRPSADDWCFLPLARDRGVAGIVEQFYAVDNGRLANGLLVGLYARFQVAGHRWYAAVSAVIVLGLLWALTALLLRRTGLRAPRGTALLVAAVAGAVFLLATPNTYKTFYWPAASVSHTLAPALAAGAAPPLLAARGQRGRTAALATASWPGRSRGGGAGGGGGRRQPLPLPPGSRNRRERHDAGTASCSPRTPSSPPSAVRAVLAEVLTTWQCGRRRHGRAGPAGPPPPGRRAPVLPTARCGCCPRRSGVPAPATCAPSSRTRCSAPGS